MRGDADAARVPAKRGHALGAVERRRLPARHQVRLAAVVADLDRLQPRGMDVVEHERRHQRQRGAAHRRDERPGDDRARPVGGAVAAPFAAGMHDRRAIVERAQVIGVEQVERAVLARLQDHARAAGQRDERGRAGAEIPVERGVALEQRAPRADVVGAERQRLAGGQARNEQVRAAGGARVAGRVRIVAVRTASDRSRRRSRGRGRRAARCWRTARAADRADPD